MKRAAALALVCLLLAGCGSKKQAASTTPNTTSPATQPAHIHTFGEWTETTYDTCAKDGEAVRECSSCGEKETRLIPATNHKLNKQGICENCWYVKQDSAASFAELGIITDYWYLEGTDANIVWDVKIWNGKVYRGAGDYDINSGETVILAYNIATGRWENTGKADDEAIQRFVEIGDTLYAPGLDAMEGWELGNFYVLQQDGWQKMRTLPNGIHNFDLIEYEGKLFAGLGTDYRYNTTAYSTDGGKTFQYAPMYKDGVLFNDEAYEYTRNYEFMVYKGQLYSLMRFIKSAGSDCAFFRYEDGKMVYVGDASAYTGGRAYNRNYFSGKFEFNGKYFLTAGYLYALTDFTGNTDGKKISMPGGENVVDALLYEGTIYVLATAPDEDKGHKIMVYKSATGEEGSFTEVVSFSYQVTPCAFDFDGTDFYIGMNVDEDHEEQSGMLVRARAK